ncbi:MAG TPA: histidine kinase [Mycobacteriales bacterium]|nr:histidine kinase [Mycobacteriales bacterium]
MRALTATGSLRLPVAAFRGVLLLTCAALAVLPDGLDREAVGRVVVLAVIAVVATLASGRASSAVPVGIIEATVAGAFIAGTGGGSSPLLPYLLAPGLALGVAGGFRAPLLGAGAAAVSAVAVRVTAGGAEPAASFVVVVGQWVALSAGVGVLAAGALRQSAASAPEGDRYAEAHALLQQLRAVSARLPGGLDAPAAASALLDRCAQLAPSTRSAVLVQRGGGEQLVPLAVLGTRRVPWRAPLSSPGPLREAWDGDRPLVDVRRPDRAGRRKGSALAVVPLRNEEGPFGLVVLEALDPAAFPAERIDAVVEAVQEDALRLETALLFEEVRSSVTLEERDRLARQMHDGMAQDIAYLGYQLDALRSQAAGNPELADGLAEVRGRLTSLISDIRLSITDLRTSVDTERGLGSALSSYVRAITAGRDVRVHLSLQESAFRLPGECEVALFRVVQAVASDMRKGRRTGQLWVTLSTDPPSATLQVEHDGAVEPSSLDLREHAAAVERLGGTLSLGRGPSGGPRVVVELGGDDGAGQRPAGR